MAHGKRGTMRNETGIPTSAAPRPGTAPTEVGPCVGQGEDGLRGGNLPAKSSPWPPARTPAGGFQAGQKDRPSSRQRDLAQRGAPSPAAAVGRRGPGASAPPPPPNHQVHPVAGPPAGPEAATPPCPRARRGGAGQDSYLVDPASSHMLVSNIKPCMCEYKQTIQ